ncbi:MULTISPECIES: hypothetical protein [Actinomadura]|uniref:HTH cro/C1-type domain-containing protein n=1 Tax=Actinomadura litoris TaxID=2678616 RepID=A0A7K1L1U3_9ACTN|nr:MULTISPECIES: hypothetical protein [Actinomadura]MBT2206550.1 hypothetical protein [Actinomadura sp. NEAU-AAG7]MUN38347.1 hypothetical protein [Actinomadura litoris]
MDGSIIPAPLKAIMAERECSQVVLAEDLGISQAFVSQLVGGKRDYGINKMNRCLASVGWEVRIEPKAKEKVPVERRRFIAGAASVTFVAGPKTFPFQNPDYVHGLAVRLTDSTEQLGGTSLVPTVLRYMGNLRRITSSRDERLLEAAAELSRVSAHALYDARQRNSAEEAGRLALVFSRRSADPAEIAQAYESLCLMTTALDANRAAHYAQLGLQVPDVPEEQRARLNARLGTALARNAHTSRIAARSVCAVIDKACSVSGLPSESTALILGSAGISNASLHRYEEADAALAASVRTFGERPLYVALWRARQIMTTLSAGDVAKAAHQMSALSGVVPLVASGRLDTKVQQILTVAERWKRVPEMKDATLQLRSVAPPTPARSV